MKLLLFKIWKAYHERLKLYKARPAALRRAIRRAKRLQRKHKKRYRVYFLQNKYQCLTRDQIKRKKRAGEFVSTMNVTKMQPLAFYDTLTGTPEMTRKLLTA